MARAEASDIFPEASPGQFLRRVVAKLRAGALSFDEAQCLADRFERYLADPRRVSLERAFGVEIGAGGEHWVVSEARAIRDRAIADYMARHRGTDVGREIRLYARTQWRRDRRLAEMPSAYAGRPRELLFRALRANESISPNSMPSSSSYLQRVAASYCVIEEKPLHQPPHFHDAPEVALSKPETEISSDAFSRDGSRTAQWRRRARNDS